MATPSQARTPAPVSAAARVAPVAPSPPTVPDEYREFPNVEARNLLQARFEVALFARSLNLPEGGRVLEVGCGRGVALPVLHRLLRPSRLVGLDIEAAFLREAEARVTGLRIELYQGDVRALPFFTASFDVVVDFGTCYHIAEPWRAGREIARVLDTGGLFATETKAAQCLSHPIRTRGRRLPVGPGNGLRLVRHALLWAAYVREPQGTWGDDR